ncbi:lipase family protein [Gordonia sputi]|uniref:Lipase n=1 Tax=Gordonia sputi NBRC 100414 TaxID=1089453 RepID=H5U6A1_9ACTN|nr:alpha/beta hydrolase [Gordonia sputi]GAB41259.1 hypothetical protein GOSPT_125_00260 [Gordonia sputi NBRC 100414]
MRKALVVAYACVVTLCVATACGNDASPAPVTKTTQARGDVLATSPGLDSWTAVLPPHTRVTRLNYTSTSGVDNSQTAVTGAVFVPGGSWPAGGWPLIAFAHGTTGLARDCGPSDHPDMFGEVSLIGSFIRAGYAVVTTDYQGLSTRVDAPAHPYLEPRTAAYNVIDSVHAARSVEPTIGAKWVVVGPSQGGAAAWATAEQYGEYEHSEYENSTQTGELVGAVAMSPVLDMTGYADAAAHGTLNTAQRFLYPLIVVGASRTDSRIDPGTYLPGLSTNDVDSRLSCATGRSALAAQSHSPDPQALGSTATQDSSDATEQLRNTLQRFALPSARTDVPILAIYGSADEINPVQVTEAAVTRACSVGDRVERDRREGLGHSFDPGPILGEWIGARMRGLHVRSDC